MGDTVSDLERKNLLNTVPGAFTTDTIADLRLKKYRSVTTGLLTTNDFEKKWLENDIANELASDTLYDLRRKHYQRVSGVSGSGLTTDDMHMGIQSGAATPPTLFVVGHTKSVDAAATSLITATLPGGLQTNDTLYAMLLSTDTAAGALITPTLPPGWVVMNALADQGTMQRAMYEANYAPGLAPIQWASAAARRMGFLCVAVRGISLPPVHAAVNAGASSTIAFAPGVSVLSPGLAIRMYCRKDNLSTGVTLPPGHTSIGQIIGGAPGPAPHVVACVENVAAAGMTNSAEATFTTATVNSTAWTIAVA